MKKIINTIIIKILVGLGRKKMGNYIYIENKYKHIDAIRFEVISGSFLILFLVGFLWIFYKILWIIC